MNVVKRLLGLLCAYTATHSVFAGTTVYENDQSGWAASASMPLTIIDFESPSLEDGESFNITPNTFTSRPLSPAFSAVDSPTSASSESMRIANPTSSAEAAGTSPVSGSNLLTTADSLTAGFGPQGAFEIQFDSVVYSLGAYFIDVEEDFDATGIEVDGSFYSFSQGYGNGEGIFFGIHLEDGFSSAIIHLSSDAESVGDGVSLDDLSYSVPAPGTHVIMILAAVAARRRR